VCPVPRWRYFLARVGGVLLALAVVVALIAIVFGITAALSGIRLSWSRAALAMALLLPLASAVAAFGFVVSAYRPGAVAAITGGVVIASFFLDTLAPLFGWPDMIGKLSVFRLYGQPLLLGVQWGNAAILVGLTALLALVGCLIFARKDIAR
jgi:ABC-type transport system involved in multi-copper enzyme maturation permease subunit